MTEEEYPLKTLIEGNLIFMCLGAVLGTIVGSFGFSDKWWYGTLTGAVVLPVGSYLSPIVTSLYIRVVYGYTVDDD